MNFKKLILSFKYAFTGIFTALKKEQNMKIHFLIMSLVIILGFIYNINCMEWIICLICFALVISLEMVNTSIESTVNLITKDRTPLAKIAKDVAAGSVLVSAIISAIIGLIIFIPKIF